MDKRFTAKELREFDGRDGRRAYVAYRGKVYDLADGPTWGDGAHFDEHFAGVDLTEAMENAPHGDDVLEAFEIVGDFEG